MAPPVRSLILNGVEPKRSPRPAKLRGRDLEVVSEHSRQQQLRRPRTPGTRSASAHWPFATDRQSLWCGSPSPSDAISEELDAVLPSQVGNRQHLPRLSIELDRRSSVYHSCGYTGTEPTHRPCARYAVQWAQAEPRRARTEGRPHRVAPAASCPESPAHSAPSSRAKAQTVHPLDCSESGLQAFWPPQDLRQDMCRGAESV